jgi:TIGR03009 family protein
MLQAAPPENQKPEQKKTAAPAASSAEKPSACPFSLTPAEEKEVDEALARWEHWNARVKTFECRFKLWTYHTVFRQQGVPKFIEFGSIKFQSPDKIIVRIVSEEKDGRITPIEDNRAQWWVCDGKSFWDYSPVKKTATEYKLSPVLNAIHPVDGPLSFLFPSSIFIGLFSFTLKPHEPSAFPFSAKANILKQEYYIRKFTSPDHQDQIQLEAYPRGQNSASYAKRLQLIFQQRDMAPFALMIVDPNGKDYSTYQFFEMKINQPTKQTDEDTFPPKIPIDWQLIHDYDPIESVLLPRNGRK